MIGAVAVRSVSIGLSIAGVVAMLAVAPTGETSAIPAGAGSQAVEDSLITHGPLVGAVTDSGATIAVRTNIAARLMAVGWSAGSIRDDLHRSAIETSSPEDDFVVQLELSGLQPSTTYQFGVIAVGASQRQLVRGQFTTFPPAGVPADFSFVVISDSMGWTPAGTFPAPIYAVIASLQPRPAFLLQIGDFDHRDPATLTDPPEIDSWRTMHKDLIHDDASGVDFARYIAPNFPFFHIWDDHDYGRNNSDKRAPWKGLAMEAFKEYFPLPPLANPSAGLWHTFRYAHAQFFILDLRSQRDADGTPEGPGKSMLAGDPIPNDQKSWLIQELKASTAAWKFVISTVPWNPTVDKLDSWANFSTERQELMDLLAQSGIEGIIVISADIHTGGAIDDGRYSGLPEISVPHTNLINLGGDMCTAFDCGLWSEGFFPGEEKHGYALIEVLRGPIDQVTLNTWSTDFNGDVFAKSLNVVP